MDAVKLEQQTKSRNWRLWVLVTVLIVVFFVRVLLLGPTCDTVTFRIVDPETGQPVSNAMASIYGRVTMLPVEKLGLGLNPWRTTLQRSEGGSLTVSGIPRKSSDCLLRIIFAEPGSYSAVIFTARDDGYWLNYSERPEVSLPRTNLITLPLERRQRR